MGNDDGRRSRIGAAGLLFVLLGVIFGTGRLTGDGGDGSSKEAAASGATADKAGGNSTHTDSENDYRRPYLEFRGGFDDETKKVPAPKLNLGQILACDYDQGRIEAQFLIATVPDPIDSRFGYRFDSVLDSVQMAVESRGWRFDRSWLPWWPSGRQLGDREKPRPVDDGSELVDRHLHEAKPGVMLFRGKRQDHNPRQPLLVVLLVGETPTSGIAKGALTESLNVIGSYHESIALERAVRHFVAGLSFWSLLKVSSPIEVRVIGPFFSGSAPSLASTISRWLERWENVNWPTFVTVSVRSGSAARINKQKFQTAAGHGRLRSRISYDATVLHLDAVMPSLFKFLHTCNGGQPLGKVALLTESDTEFGAVRSKVTRKWADAQGTIVTTMKFPFHISELAVAYDQRDRKKEKNGTTLVRPSSRLTIPFDETGSPRDVVPSLSPAMDTARSEFLMSKILETIAMEDFRYVGINASDTRDVIFLAGLIHQYCPDVQLFVTEGDLLLGHPRYSSELRGMIVATSYPLFSMSQKWTPPYKGEGRRHLFSNQGDQGVFNAVVSLLEEQVGEGEYCETLFDYGPPFEEMKNLSVFATIDSRNDLPIRSQPRLRPSLWFNVVGARGLWPVYHQALDDPRDNSGYTFTAVPKGYQLLLKPAVNDVGNIPKEGKNLIVVAALDGVLHFRIFDHDGKVFVNTHEKCLPEQAGRIEQLTTELKDLWPPHALTGIERDYVIAAVASILDLTIQPQQEDGIDAAKYVSRLLAIIPQFSWQWGTVFFGMVMLAWLLFWHHSLMVHIPSSRGIPGLWWIAPSAPTDSGSAAGARRIAFSPREPYAVAGLIAFTAVFTYVALTPCWIAFFESPWRLFLRPGLSDYVPRKDWNIAFGYVAFCLGHVTLAALLWTVIRRIRYALGGRVGPGGKALKWFVVVDVALLLLLVLLPVMAFAALAPLEWQHPVGRFSGLLFIDRAANFASGLSPFVPVLLLLTISLFWVAMQTRRIDLAERSWGPAPASLAEWTLLETLGNRILGSVRAGGRHLKEFLKGSGGYVAIPLRWLADQWRPDRRVNPAAKPKTTKTDRGPAKESRRKKERHEAGPSAASVSGPGSTARALHGNVEAAPAAIESEAQPAASEPAPFWFKRPSADLRFASFKDAYEDARHRVRALFPAALWVGLWHVSRHVPGRDHFRCALCLCAIPTVDFTGGWTTALMAAIWFLALTVVLALSRFLQIWVSLRRLLRLYMGLPMARAFDRIPPIFSRSFGRYLDRTHKPGELLTIPIQQWAMVAEGFDQRELTPLLMTRYNDGLEVTTSARGNPFELVALAITARDPRRASTSVNPRAAERIQKLFLEEFRRGPSGAQSDSSRRRGFVGSPTWDGLHEASRACLDVLDAYWLAKAPGTSFGDTKVEAAGSTPSKDAEFLGASDEETRWLRSAEDLIAMAVVTHISLIAAHLKNLATYLSVAPILLLLAVSSYPFQPGRLLEMCMWGLLLMVVGCVVWVYIGMEQDELLSRVSKTAPGSIAFDRQFLGSVMTFLIPLLGLALAQFPFVSDAMNQWFAPLTRVLK